MKTHNTYYKDAEQFEAFIHDNGIVDSPNLLVQIFCAMNDVEIIQAVVESIASILPLCHLIGATTDGEIVGASVSIHSIGVSLSTFEHTTLKSYGAHRTEEGCFALGSQIVQAIFTPSTKAIISFCDGTNTNGESYLEGLDTLAHHTTVAGGLAGNVFKVGQTYVFNKDIITCNGAVGVSLNSTVLKVHTDYSFNWTPIGQELVITHAKENRVFSIDDKTACEAYAYYLGEDVAANIPNINIEFPLILYRDGVSIARAALSKKEDGSIVFAGNVKEGDKVRIGFGNAELILQDATKTFDAAEHKPIESVFIYSCMARRRYMQESCSLEIEPWAKIAPVVGFFTYGEFFTKDASKKYLMNQTMTILALSEKEKTYKYEAFKKNIFASKRMMDYAKSIKALSHFINITSEELVSINRRLNRAIDGSRDGLWNWNLENDEVYFSARFKQILGFEDAEFKNDLGECRRRLHPEDRERILTSIQACRDGKNEAYNEVFRMKHKNGSWVWIHSRGTFFYNDEGKIIRASGFHTDVTEEKTDALHQEEQRRFLQSVINGIDASVVVVDTQENIILSNQTAQNFFVEALFATPKSPSYQELYMQKPNMGGDLSIFHPMKQALQSSQVVTATTKRLHQNGRVCDMEITITPLIDIYGRIMGAIEVGHDVSLYLSLQKELELQKQSLQHIAHHDALTGLPNRLIFSDRLGVALTKASRSQEMLAVLFIDLDRFKQINDTLGHECGDVVLKTVAQRFKTAIRESDTLVRLGGDEFIIILDKMQKKEDVILVVKKILQQAIQPIVYKEHLMTLSASIGIAMYPTNGEDEANLLKHADKAMYEAKNKGGNTYAFYES